MAGAQDEADEALISEALDAINAGDFEQAAAKAQEVISRFEATRRPNARYACSSGPGDLPAPVADTTTITVSRALCTAHFLKGFVLIDLDRRDEAKPYLEAAVAMDPDNDHYANELGEWYKPARQWETSLEIFTRASQTNDQSLDLMDKVEAERIRNERRCRSYRGIAFNQVELHQWDEARAALGKCLAIVPGDKFSEQELRYINEQIAQDR